MQRIETKVLYGVYYSNGAVLEGSVERWFMAQKRLRAMRCVVGCALASRFVFSKKYPNVFFVALLLSVRHIDRAGCCAAARAVQAYAFAQISKNLGANIATRMQDHSVLTSLGDATKSIDSSRFAESATFSCSRTVKTAGTQHIESCPSTKNNIHKRAGLQAGAGFADAWYGPFPHESKTSLEKVFCKFIAQTSSMDKAGCKNECFCTVK